MEASGDWLFALLFAVDRIGSQVVGEGMDGRRRTFCKIQIEMRRWYGSKILVRGLLRHHRAKALAQGLQITERVWSPVAIQHLPMPADRAGYGEAALGTGETADCGRPIVDPSPVRILRAPYGCA